MRKNNPTHDALTNHLHKPTRYLYSLAFGCLSMLFVLSTPLSSYAGHDQLGTASFSLEDCTSTTVDPNGLPNGTCYQVTISNCAGGGTFTAHIKMNAGNSSHPVIFFTTGEGGNAWYDANPLFYRDTSCPDTPLLTHNCGGALIQRLNTDGFDTVQTNFSDMPADPMNPNTAEPVGWATGPAPVTGPRALVCRYATLVHETWKHFYKPAGKHVCATGNSGGASAIAYALTQYGLGRAGETDLTFSFADLSSGPPHSRVDQGCRINPPMDTTFVCQQSHTLTYVYDPVLAVRDIDEAYDGDCQADGNCFFGNNISCNPKTHIDDGDQCASTVCDPTFPHDKNFLHTSIVSEDYPAPTLSTAVRFLFGNADYTGNAVAQGHIWLDALMPNNQPTIQCVTSDHNIPGHLPGIDQIRTDMNTYCQ
jgi:hypothetical protein